MANPTEMYFGKSQIQGGSNMTGTDFYKRTHKSVPVIFEPPCIQGVTGGTDQTSGECSLGQTIPI